MSLTNKDGQPRKLTQEWKRQDRIANAPAGADERRELADAREDRKTINAQAR
jgi:hypothetical protein